MTSRGLEAAVLALPRPFAAATLMHRERLVVGEERARIARNIDRHQVDLYPGTASFIDARTLGVNGLDGVEKVMEAEAFLSATGSRPHPRARVPFHPMRIYLSD